MWDWKYRKSDWVLLESSYRTINQQKGLNHYEQYNTKQAILSTWNYNKNKYCKAVSWNKRYFICLPKISYLQSIAYEVEQAVWRNKGIPDSQIAQTAYGTPERSYGAGTEMDMWLPQKKSEYFNLWAVRKAPWGKGIQTPSRLPLPSIRSYVIYLNKLLLSAFRIRQENPKVGDTPWTCFLKSHP